MDTAFYATKVKVSKEDKARLKLMRHEILPKWNYTIRPHSRATKRTTYF